MSPPSSGLKKRIARKQMKKVVRSTGRYTSEDITIYNHLCENLKSYAYMVSGC
jgi:hypothetical protein